MQSKINFNTLWKLILPLRILILSYTQTAILIHEIFNYIGLKLKSQYDTFITYRTQGRTVFNFVTNSVYNLHNYVKFSFRLEIYSKLILLCPLSRHVYQKISKTKNCVLTFMQSRNFATMRLSDNVAICRCYLRKSL